MNSPDPFTAAVEALGALVARRVVDELRPLLVGAHVPASGPPPLLDKRELARTLAVSPATITRLVQEGAPHTFVGSSPRFDVKAFRAWLDERGRRGTTAKPSSGPIAGVRLLSRGAK
jgi:hypothetical protein